MHAMENLLCATPLGRGAPGSPSSPPETRNLFGNIGNTVLGTPIGSISILRTQGAARRVAQSVVKDCPAVSFAAALEHHALFDKVNSLQEERTRLQQEVLSLKEQNEKLLCKLAEAEANQCFGVGGPEQGEDGGAGDNLQTRLLKLQGELVVAQQERRLAHNQLIDLKGSIRTFCRVRRGGGEGGRGGGEEGRGGGAYSNPPPPLQVRPHDGPSNVRLLPDNTTIQLSHAGHEYTFAFSRIFPAGSSQKQVFSEVAEFVQSSLDGYQVGRGGRRTGR